MPPGTVGMELGVRDNKKHTKGITMSLDVHLIVRKKVVYSANITHNLGNMASRAGVYYALWRPEEIGIKRAKWLIPILNDGLESLQNFPGHYKQFSSPNGWGLYEHFVPFVEGYLAACKEYPEATIEVCR